MAEEEYRIGDTVILWKADMSRLVQILAENHEIYGPIERDGVIVFDRIARANEMAHYIGSNMLPLKYFLHKPMETIFYVKKAKDFEVKEAEVAETKQVLFAVHSCDVNAMLYLDKVFTGDFYDPYYAKRRENTFIVALNCTEIAENCLCTSVGAGPYLEDEGFDLLLTNLGDRYTMKIGSEKGRAVVRRMGLRMATMEELDLKNRKIQIAIDQMPKDKFIDTRDLPEILNREFDNPYWEKVKDDCLSCGNCTMVCPTCYCYDVIDKVDLSLSNIERGRVWDSCQLLEFASVHGGNFRKERSARIKQWVYHKLNYSREQYNSWGCVGCGRCIVACPAEIDLTEIIREIRKGGEHANEKSS